MAYKKTNWQPTLKDAQGNVQQQGTPLTASYLNNIENGIAQAAEKEEVQEVVRKLADTGMKVVSSEQRMNTEIIPRKVRKPIMSFTDDDGRTSFVEKWLGIIQEKKIPVTIGVITGSVGTTNYLTWEQLKALRDNYSVELVNHTHNHKYTGTLTDADIYTEFKTSTEILKAHGAKPEIMVYPYGSQSDAVRRIGREFFRAAFDIRQTINLPPLETYRINRVSLADSANNTLDFYKSKVDECVANNGWLVWMSHSQYETFDDLQIQHIKALIDYARSKGVEITNTSDALDKFGNIIDVGDFAGRALGNEYTVMGVDGVIQSKSNSKDFYVAGEGSLTKPLTAYPAKAKTVELILTANATGFPENTAGILETFRGASDSFSYRIYKIINKNTVYKQTWNTGAGSWNAFERIDSLRIGSRFTYSIVTDVLAGQVVNVSFEHLGLSIDDNLIGSPRAGIESGLMYNVFVTTANNFRVRLYNPTAATITTNRTWKFDVIKP